MATNKGYSVQDFEKWRNGGKSGGSSQAATTTGTSEITQSQTSNKYSVQSFEEWRQNRTSGVTPGGDSVIMDWMDRYSKKGKVPISMNHVFTDGEISKIRLFYDGLLSDYPDVMTTLDVSRFTGYHRNSVSLWCSKGHLKCFFIRQQYMVPKEYLIEFLLGDYFYQIITKSAKHKWFINQIRLIVD